MSKFKKTLTVVFAVYMSIAVLGKLTKDIDGAEREANLYCKNVHYGIWPDYEQQYVKYCNGPKWNGK